MYLTFAGFFLLGVFLTSKALNRLGCFSVVERAVIVYGAHFCLCMTAFLGHYQLFAFQLAPPFFLYLYLYLTRWRFADGHKRLDVPADANGSRSPASG